MLEVTILSVLQGISEFLPISSSGHLVIGKELLGLGEVGIRLDVFLHAGTLLAVIAFYFSTLRSLFLNMVSKGADRKEAWLYVSKIVLSAIPIGVVGILFNDNLTSLFSSPRMVGAALAFTSCILISTRFFKNSNAPVTFKSALLMSLAQVVAIIPGVSRSGMTLSMAKALGVENGKAAEFSFLMSIPPIAGAALYEIIMSMQVSSAATEVSWGLTLYGAALAALTGYVSLALLLKILKSKAFWMFGVYTLAVSAAVLIFM